MNYKDYCVKTRNKMGYMNKYLNPISKEFIDNITDKDNILDIGCGYGVCTIPALKKANKVTALDLDPTHLKKLENAITDKDKEKLELLLGSVTLVKMKRDKYDSIHCSKVLHFLNNSNIKLALKKMYKWLKTSGKLYITISYIDKKKINGALIDFNYDKDLYSHKDYPNLFSDDDNCLCYNFIDIKDLENICITIGYKIINSKIYEYPLNKSEKKEVMDEIIGLILTK